MAPLPTQGNGLSVRARHPARAAVLIDTAGNAANLYDTIDRWDDLNHFVNWAILVAACGQLLVRLPLGRAETAALAIGFGAVTAVLWEFAEYVTFIRHSAELSTAYTDTLGDLALGLTGSVLAAVLTITILWPRETSAGAESGAPGPAASARAAPNA